ncbi:MAG TPA: DUF1015 domain-containing protein [Pseudonocardia sp.]
MSQPPAGLALRPFVAARYSDPARLRALTSPAYDLIAPAERAQLAGADPHSIVHLTLPTFGVQDAARRLTLWRREGVLCTDPQPALFVYEMAEATGTPITRGWIGAVGIPPRSSGGAAAAPIVPHEDTVAAVVADRLRLRAATEADLEPIVLAHDGGPAEAERVADAHVAAGVAIIDLVDGSGVRHRVWRVDDPAQVAAVCADVASRRAVIADGHHRYASATAHRNMIYEATGEPGPAGRILALLVPIGLHGPRVQAIHRVVPGLPLAVAAATADEVFQVDPIGPLTDHDADELLGTAADTLLLVTDGTRWLRFTRPQRRQLVGRPDWQDLDVALTDVGLVAERWGAADSVVLRHAVGAAVTAARQCDGVAVLLRPTPASTVLDLAARGVLMPRKSTFFVPKPRTGLLMRCFADEPGGESARPQ